MKRPSCGTQMALASSWIKPTSSLRMYCQNTSSTTTFRVSSDSWTCTTSISLVTQRIESVLGTRISFVGKSIFLPWLRRKRKRGNKIAAQPALQAKCSSHNPSINRSSPSSLMQQTWPWLEWTICTACLSLQITQQALSIWYKSIRCSHRFWMSTLKPRWRTARQTPIISAADTNSHHQMPLCLVAELETWGSCRRRVTLSTVHETAAALLATSKLTFLEWNDGSKTSRAWLRLWMRRMSTRKGRSWCSSLS